MERKIEKAYARALFQISVEKKIEEKVKEDVAYLEEVFRKNPELLYFFQEAGIAMEKKKKVLSKIFEGKIEKDVLCFLQVLLQKKQIEKLMLISEELKELFRKEEDEEEIFITTSYSLQEEEKRKIEIYFAKIYIQKKLKIRYLVKEELIGGMIVQNKDMIYDNSLLRQMELLKNSLIEAAERREESI